MDHRSGWKRKSALSTEGWIMLLRTLAEQHLLCCPVCQVEVTPIDVHEAGIIGSPCGHPLQFSPPDAQSPSR